MRSSKHRVIKLLEILEKYTDEENGLSTNEILAKLGDEGFEIHRQTLYEDIKVLEDCGIDIVCNSGSKNTNTYCLVSRKHDLSELRILIDAVQYSYFITENKTRELIHRLTDQLSVNQAKQLNSQLLYTDRIKSTNEHIFYSVGALHNAILQKKKINFQYYKFTYDGKLELKNSGEYYVVSPYTLALSNNKYYLVCFSEKYNEITQFRVDKMTNVSILDEDIRKLPEDFNMVKYTQKVFSMYKGELKEMTFHFHESVLDYIFEKFGNKPISKVKDETYSVCASASISPTFFGWIYQFGGKIKIVSPDEVIEELRQYAEDFLKSI